MLTGWTNLGFKSSMYKQNLSKFKSISEKFKRALFCSIIALFVASCTSAEYGTKEELVFLDGNTQISAVILSREIGSRALREERPTPTYRSKAVLSIYPEIHIRVAIL